MILKVQYFTICAIVSSIYACYFSRLLAGNQLMVKGGMRKAMLTLSLLFQWTD